jgi:hypothetical protein
MPARSAQTVVFQQERMGVAMTRLEIALILQYVTYAVRVPTTEEIQLRMEEIEEELIKLAEDS